MPTIINDVKEFYRLRRDNINSHVPIINVLQKHGVTFFDKGGRGSFACPFHGQDNRPSAMFYEESNSTWCFKCQDRLDIIGWEMKAQGLRFASAVSYVERAYGVPGLDIILDDEAVEDEFDVSVPAVDNAEGMAMVIQSFQRNLLGLRDSLDMHTYLRCFSITDRLSHDLETDGDLEAMAKVLGKAKEMVRAAI